MNMIHYIDKYKDKEIIDNPEKAWEWFDGNEVMPYEMDSVEEQTSISTIVCYSEKYLTILVKSNQKNISFRDRSYQNGDGFHFVLANPSKDNLPSNEFYVIGISPLDSTWKHKFIWYKNVDLEMTYLKDTPLNIISNEGEHISCVQIPWYEIEPIQGFMVEEIGFNLSYVQGLDKGKNIYMLKEDPLIQCEQSPREYRVYDFQSPKIPKHPEYQVSFSKKHCEKDVFVSLDVAINSPCDQEYCVMLFNQKQLIFKDKLDASKGLNRRQFELKELLLGLGKHTIGIEISDKEYCFKESRELFVYDERMFDQLLEDIYELEDNSKNNLINESVHALRFQLELLTSTKNKLKDYESFDCIQSHYDGIVCKLEQVRLGRHLFIENEFIRLGHLSKIDNTYQPYSMYIPNDLDNRKLLVYLHGSGCDDTSINHSPYMKQLADESHSILLAPFARGTSHMYCTSESIEEIIELTKKTVELFKISSKNIILCGFSMGGYGTYRLYDHAPELFSRLVVLSGHPSLGKQVNGPDYIKLHEKFKGVPMLIFHGMNDMNCNYYEQIDFFENLRKTNELCEVHIDEYRGHSGMNNEWYDQLIDWFMIDKGGI